MASGTTARSTRRCGPSARRPRRGCGRRAGSRRLRRRGHSGLGCHWPRSRREPLPRQKCSSSSSRRLAPPRSSSSSNRRQAPPHSSSSRRLAPPHSSSSRRRLAPPHSSSSIRQRWLPPPHSSSRRRPSPARSSCSRRQRWLPPPHSSSRGLWARLAASAPSSHSFGRSEYVCFNMRAASLVFEGLVGGWRLEEGKASHGGGDGRSAASPVRMGRAEKGSASNHAMPRPVCMLDCSRGKPDRLGCSWEQRGLQCKPVPGWRLPAGRAAAHRGRLVGGRVPAAPGPSWTALDASQGAAGPAPPRAAST